MSALDELRNKEEKTDLDAAVIVSAYYEKQTTVFSERPTTVYSEKAAVELFALRERVEKLDKQLAWWLETYDITMPCGHKNRYLLTNGHGEPEKDFRGDCVCVICQLEKADNEILDALKSQ